jgi:Ser/Thr protein kinase RdoA (MazF antagonist)
VALRLLADHEWLSPADLGGDGVVVELSHSSHCLALVRVGGRRAVVKLAVAGSGAAARSLQAELRAYRLARWLPALAAVMPAPIALDERRQALAMEWVGPPGSWPAQQPAPPLNAEALAEFAGRVGAWHAATTGVPQPASPAYGVLGLPVDPVSAGSDRSPSTRALMLRLAAQPDVATLLSRAASAYDSTCLIHGDLRRENLLSDDDGRLKALDWDLSGLGDPAWDLGSLTALAALDAARGPITEGASGVEAWPGSVKAAAHAILQAYGRQASVVPPWPHVLDCAAARLLHVACEWTDWGGEAATVDALVAFACRLRADAPALEAVA